MSIVPIRDLGKFGVLTDVDPYNLPASAWSMGINVRFRNNAVSRAPVFRNVKGLDIADPRYVFGANPSSGLDFVFIGYANGQVSRYDNGFEYDYSAAAPGAAVEALYTHTNLASVVYVNRPDRAPWALGPSDARFKVLANWDPSWRAQLLRVCGGALVALNVTKGPTSFPTMVKTSSFPQSGTVPASWDHTVPNTLASENILAEMRGGIVDAASLGNALVIYGNAEAWLMSPSGDTFVFEYRKLPFVKGAINGNCVVEVEGKHYVFGPYDVWIHDGFTETSICDGKTRDFIFNGLNLARSNRCFVTHNAKLKEIHFCYVSGDRGVFFLNTPSGCNRQAVYNYGSGVWTFDDLPMVYAADAVNLNVVVSYATVAGTYESTGGSYLDQEDGYKRTVVYVGDTHAEYQLTRSLYAFDLYGPGSTVVFGVDAKATAPVTLEKNGIDLDAIGADLRGYKVCSSIYPQGRLDPLAAPLSFSMGSADYFGSNPIFDTTQTYDGYELYKLDYRTAGRYLAMKMTYPDYRPFTITALDFDFDVQGTR